VPVLGWLATMRIATGGDDATVDRAGMPADSFTAVHGPSFRGAYDLADLDGSLFVIAPGQSGNPISPHARDFLRRWRDGGTITLGPEPTRVSGTVRLSP
jgi:penicillin amidase